MLNSTIFRSPRIIQILFQSKFSSVRSQAERNPFTVIPEAFVTTLNDLPTTNVDLVKLNPGSLTTVFLYMNLSIFRNFPMYSSSGPLAQKRYLADKL